ncbi:exodeoxyribonuclease V subunit alpha [Aestuariimicrobium ganziense]|uniref:exodeoxyribonuclease V subunit alpha n=1 Tax=Aestuariimicrobium ganziense TaxID=2773677 RepID=UPI00194077F1|nr:exodeoxyribonuclease V subunit alpha [Aestuariimicrobium ganziense]
MTDIARDHVISATGVLRDFNLAGILDLGDVHLAQTVARLHRITDPRVVLAMALTARAVRNGSSCIDLTTIRSEVREDLLDPALRDLTVQDAASHDPDEATALVEALPWPEPQDWFEALRSSPAVADPFAEVNRCPLRLDDGLLHLERHWVTERRIEGFLAARRATSPSVDTQLLDESLARLFSPSDPLQAQAARAAATSWTSVVAGGPGTGKTTTIARLLAVLAKVHGQPPTVALAAPSGKAAARLHEAVLGAWAAPDLAGWSKPRISAGLTVHRLLGARGRHGGFRKGPDDPLAHDVVVLDEVSMLDLFLFERVLSALGPRTRLVMVGDPHQLSSVEAGRVLADVTRLGLTVSQADPTPAVVELQHNYRFSGAIQDLAHAVRSGDHEAAASVLSSGDDSVQLVDVDLGHASSTEVPGLLDDLLGPLTSMIDAAEAGDAPQALRDLDEHRLLCAHREGPFGVGRFTREVAELLRRARPGHGHAGEHHVGRPVLATTNQPDINVFNGDSGVMVSTQSGVRLALGPADQHRLLGASLVDGLETLYAMTVHKSQGSQFNHVTVVLPPLGSPLLTRELLYTALTRATQRVRLVGNLDQVEAALARPTRRLTGLARGTRAEHGPQISG